MTEDIKQLIASDEIIMWEGKPDKKCFLFESIFNPLMPFALLWAIIDLSVLGASLFGTFAEGETNIILFIIPFFLIHLMPVWMYIGGVLMTRRKYKNTYYVVTDKSIYISSGVFTKRINTKPFAEMSHIDLHRGIFDQKFGVGDIICTSSHRNTNASGLIILASIKNYTEVYNMVKKLQQDIYSDIMYPNDKRPQENHGYNTEYKGM